MKNLINHNNFACVNVEMFLKFTPLTAVAEH